MSEAQPTVAEIVENWHDQDRSVLVERLNAREEGIADMLRLAGVQFGLYPEIVAKVLMDVGLGGPVAAEVQTHLNNQFTARMEWLREQHNNG